MNQSIDLFSLSSTLPEDIYLNCLNSEIKEIFNHLKGPKNVSNLLCCKYSKSKEWVLGRKPISIKDLNLLFEACEPEFRVKIIKKIESNKIFLGCRYSKIKIKLPPSISPDLAYLTGIILGDGCISIGQKEEKKVWFLGAYFDNQDHQKIFDELMAKEFEIDSKHDQNKPNCFETYFNSKVLNWFFCSALGLPHGKKSDRIHTPQLIKKSNKKVKSTFMQGLFDSDGTITKKGEIKFSTTSKQMAYEMQEMLYEFELESSIDHWIKAERYLQLYTVRLKGKNYRKNFEKYVGFRHPVKKLLLKKFS